MADLCAVSYPHVRDFLFNGQHRGNVARWCQELRETKIPAETEIPPPQSETEIPAAGAETEIRPETKIPPETAEAERLRVEAAKREAAIAHRQQREKAKLEIAAELDRMARNRQISDLHSYAQSQEAYRRGLDRALRDQAKRQAINAALDDLNATAAALYNPPPPPAPPEPVVIEQPAEDTGKLGWVKIHRWWD